ncbi:hypothetical protein GO986_22310 [Deinococcus sp. HMF7620]|uniref:Serine protease n=1 Tax=Deinococcus arboris TaxID=2682977 RepID=A0A7C9HUL0_9DEIO|nr:hypothetical protein [Deinococcus arboris]MVN89472.1 hypothetical protein [Deinococcus arboris]
MTNFFENGLPFDPEAPSYQLKEELTATFSEEAWFVAAGTTRVGEQEAAFLTIDQLALSPLEIFVGVHQVLSGGIGTFLLSEILLGRETIQLNSSDERQLPRLVIEMSLGSAQRTSVSTTVPLLEGGQRVRLQGGQGTGTLATTVGHANGPMLLTNQHVLGAAATGDAVEVELGGVWQVAGQYECGSYSDVPFGALSTTIDAGLARLEPSGIPVGAVRGIAGHVTPARWYDVGTAVQKVGASTGRTTAEIDSLTANVRVNGSVFQNQIRVRSVQPFQQPGDSGSLLLTASSTPQAAGLLHAHQKENGVSKPEVAFASHWGAVAQALGISL